VSESSPRPRGEQPRRRWTTADLLSVLRIPLAVAFPFVSNDWRLVLLAAAAASDLLDGQLARRFGGSAFGSVIDPVAAPPPSGPPLDPRVIAREAGADIVVVGAYFARGDSIGVEARVVDAQSGRVLRAIAPVMTPRANPLAAVELLRQRVAGALAAEVDPLIAGLAREASQPPDYAAYLAWV